MRGPGKAAGAARRARRAQPCLTSGSSRFHRRFLGDVPGWRPAGSAYSRVFFVNLQAPRRRGPRAAVTRGRWEPVRPPCEAARQAAHAARPFTPEQAASGRDGLERTSLRPPSGSAALLTTPRVRTGPTRPVARARSRGRAGRGRTPSGAGTAASARGQRPPPPPRARVAPVSGASAVSRPERPR